MCASIPRIRSILKASLANTNSSKHIQAYYMTSAVRPRGEVRITNRHTPIATAIERIVQVVADIELTYEMELHRQNTHLSRTIDLSREAFSKISPYIIYKANELVVREWNAAKRWFGKGQGMKKPLSSESCELACDLPKQYSLPCKCWLLFCIPRGPMRWR